MENKEIRFIDSKYNELFRIPDGSEITIRHINGAIEHRACKYIDEYHTKIGDRTYHISEFAELMERNRNFYSPKEKYELDSISTDEVEFMFAPKEKDTQRGCIGYLRADFGSGIEFYSSWFGETEALKTDAFKIEFDEVINYFREEASTPLLKSRSDMSFTCYTMRATPFTNGTYDLSAFKVITEKHTYYLKCNPRKGDYDLYCYCYDNRHLEKYNNIQFVKNNIEAISRDKFFVSEEKVIQGYYNPDATAGGQLVYNELDASLIKEAALKHNDVDGFFDYLGSACTQYLIDIDTPEFRDNFESFINKKAEFEGCDDKSMKKIKKFAGLEKVKPPKEPER